MLGFKEPSFWILPLLTSSWEFFSWVMEHIVSFFLWSRCVFCLYVNVLMNKYEVKKLNWWIIIEKKKRQEYVKKSSFYIIFLVLLICLYATFCNITAIHQSNIQTFMVLDFIIFWEIVEQINKHREMSDRSKQLLRSITHLLL
jgi:cytochrome c oxidase assembly factor CtaG